jgi:cytochrome c oxidase subunit 3
MKTIDVSHLPTSAFGARDPVWWGITSMLAIEGTTLALIWASFVYLRSHFNPYPPSPPGELSRILAGCGFAVLALSVPPIWWAARSAKKARLLGMSIGLALCIALGVAAAILRWFEWQALEFRWDSHAYGSIFWLTSGMHAFHVVAATAENIFLLALLFKRPLEEKSLSDVSSSTLYWYFVFLTWVPSYLLMYA